MRQEKIIKDLKVATELSHCHTVAIIKVFQEQTCLCVARRQGGFLASMFAFLNLNGFFGYSKIGQLKMSENLLYLGYISPTADRGIFLSSSCLTAIPIFSSV